MLPSKERLNPSLSFTTSNECPVSPFHTQPIRPVPTQFFHSLKTVPGAKCRPNRGRRIREEDRDEAAGKAGGISLPNVSSLLSMRLKTVTYLIPKIHR